jgi:hypothetical protein
MNLTCLKIIFFYLASGVITADLIECQPFITPILELLTHEWFN